MQCSPQPIARHIAAAGQSGAGVPVVSWAEDMKDLAFTRQEEITSIPQRLHMWDIPAMEAELETLRERLRERLEQRGMSARALSLALGANTSYIAQILQGRGGMPSAGRLHRIAELLETTTDWLLGRAADSRQPFSEVSVREDPRKFSAAGANGIPVVGTGYCDDLAIEGPDGEYMIERIQFDIDTVVRFVQRPSALWNAREAYAIDLHGDSMSPVMEQGETRLVDPRRPPGPGDFVVVQLTNGTDHDVATVLVKRLVRAASTFVELAQFNPPLTFRVPRAQVARLHRIVPYSELLY